MRHEKPRAIDALLPRTRQRVLGALLLRPERWWYRSEIAAHLGVRPSSLQRELEGLATAGVLAREVRGRTPHYRADTRCPFFPELRGLIAKTSGLADVLGRALAPLADRIAVAFVYGSVASGVERPDSDIDLMIIGRATLRDVVPALRGVSGTLGREVNPRTFAPREFADRAAAGDNYVTKVLRGDKILLIGSERELESTGQGRTGRTIRPDAGGPGRHAVARGAKPPRRGTRSTLPGQPPRPRV
jgi:predicted nucleotidyltransferase